MYEPDIYYAFTTFVGERERERDRQTDRQREREDKLVLILPERNLNETRKAFESTFCIKNNIRITFPILCLNIFSLNPSL